MKSFSLACILFFALAGSAASQQGQWISLESDAIQDAKLTEIALPSIKYGGDIAADIVVRQGSIAGASDTSIAKALGKMAELYWLRRRYSDADTVYGQVLHLREKNLGPEHPELAKDYNNFALILAARGLHPEAEQHYKRALEIAAKAAGDHPDFTIIRNNYEKFIRNQ